MAHKSFFGGSAYEIGGGKTLIGGTAYSIDKGKTLVDGTAYEIAFAPSVITVKITGTGNSIYTHVTINGTKYYSAKTLEIKAGTSITVTASANASNRPKCYIMIDGTKIRGSSDSGAVYTFTPDCTTVNIALSHSGAQRTNYATITTS